MLKKGKKYYKIGEISQIIGVEPHVLRFWEKEFRQIQPRRVSRRRLYREQDLKALKRIKELLYVEGYTIAGAKRRLEQELSEKEAKKGADLPDSQKVSSDRPEKSTPLSRHSDDSLSSSQSRAAVSAKKDQAFSSMLEDIKEELLAIKSILDRTP